MSATPAILLYAPDGQQFQRYGGTRGFNSGNLGRTAQVAGDGPTGMIAGRDDHQRLPFGTQMILQDGRKYRFAVAGGTLLVVGDLEQAAANVAGNVNQTAVASALGSRTPQVTVGATSTTGDQYAGGYAVVSVTPDAGNVYLIDNHAAATNGTTQTLNLAPGHAVRSAAWTTTSRVDFIKNPYDSVIQSPVTTPTGVPVGVAVTALAAYLTAGTALSFGWLQTRGLASVLTSGTVVLGNTVVPNVAAGAIGAFALTEGTPNTGAGQEVVGWVQRVAATTAWSTIFLKIDG